MMHTNFEERLNESVALHGHLCAGQVIGVRMALLALSKLGIQDPKGRDRKKLYVVVEIDRCATDAIQSVTGCSLGKRTMRHEDLGIMAATFINLWSFEAARVTAREDSRELSKKYFPEVLDKYEQQLLAYKIMPDNELFSVQNVQVSIPEEDMPGKPLSRVACQSCGDWVQDRREVLQNGRILCRGCVNGKYYNIKPEISRDTA
jgi:formylmethanofuran dehydrogenase subunit E